MALDPELLHHLSDAYGLHHGYHDLGGHYHAASEDTRLALLKALGVAVENADDAKAHLAQHGGGPFREDIDCPTAPRAVAADSLGKTWGVTLPLYGLRSKRNWGLGDFEDLRHTVELAAREGAAFVGINPVHALFPRDAARYSPYSPSSRNHLNVMHIAPDLIVELKDTNDGRSFLSDDSLTQKIDALRVTDHVDYEGVYKTKMLAFEHAYTVFSQLDPGADRRAAFDDFLQKRVDSLWHHALYEALADHLGDDGAAHYDWRSWPEGYENPLAPRCVDFAKDHSDRIRFYAYLQWIAEEQLHRAQATAKAAGMAVGLYLDLAVGMTPDGAEAWSGQDIVVHGVSLGAPGDAANPDGQMWNLAPLNPHKLRATGFAHLRETLRETMRSAGMIRIDHILGVNRSYWCPEAEGVAGGYISQPLDDLLGVIAHEANAAGCIVVGEDLGIVPDGFRERLHASGLLGCALFLFERYGDGGFKQPVDYPDCCLASVSNHDFPTLLGFLDAADLRWREALGIGAEPDLLARDREARETDRYRIRAMLHHGGWLDDETAAEDVLSVALHRFLAESRSQLLAVQVEDLLGQIAQMNVPGTTTEQPNWRRKLRTDLDEMFVGELAQSILGAVRSARPGH